jgi:glycosyltransferase involved in cell wall biosynthesis
MAKRIESALIATISDILGEDGDRVRHSNPAWPLIEYFRARCDRLTVLELSLPRKGMVFRPQVSRFEGGRFVEMKTCPRLGDWPFTISEPGPRTYFRLKFRDILALFWAAGLYKEKYDLFIGVESLLAMGGGMLKKMGRVRESVYYISDWSPWKFQNKALNAVYLKMDWLACKWSDFIWNFTYTIGQARREILHFDMDRTGRELWVPFGFIPDGVTIPEDGEIDRRKLVFCGGLCRENGVELIIEALPRIIEAAPGVVVEILGDGPAAPALKERAEALGVADSIVWRGYVADRKEILRTYLTASASLAPYMPFKENVKRYGDVIKIRESIGCGLPVVTTDVAPTHTEVLEKGLGEVIPYEAGALAEACARILTDDAYYFPMRGRVIASSRENLWENIYGRTLAAMGVDEA